MSAAPIILVGGTFDPPHRAHVELPVAVREAAAPGAVLRYVPAGRSPFKAQAPIASDEDRVEMLARALRSTPEASIWPVELGTGNAPGEVPPSYTIETVLRAHAEAPGRMLRLLIGADQAAAFHKWREFREVIRLAEPLVMVRSDAPDLSSALAESGAWSLEELRAWAARVVPIAPLTMSSTEARVLLGNPSRSGAEERRLGEILDPEVRAYIDRRGLYR